MYAWDCINQNVRMLLELGSDWFVLGWNVSAATTVLLPLLMLTISRLVHWDADNGNGDNDNGDDNNNNNNNNSGSWWHWGNSNNNGQVEEGSNDNAIPWWWFGGRHGSVDSADRAKGSLIFVYIYSMGLFVILTLYGSFVLRRGSEYGPLQGEFWIEY